MIYGIWGIAGVLEVLEGSRSIKPFLIPNLNPMALWL